MGWPGSRGGKLRYPDSANKMQFALTDGPEQNRGLFHFWILRILIMRAVRRRKNMFVVREQSGLPSEARQDERQLRPSCFVRLPHGFGQSKHNRGDPGSRQKSRSELVQLRLSIFSWLQSCLFQDTVQCSRSQVVARLAGTVTRPRLTLCIDGGCLEFSPSSTHLVGACEGRPGLSPAQAKLYPNSRQVLTFCDGTRAKCESRRPSQKRMKAKKAPRAI
jgi:hypothetical protein